ncbi:MAG: L,D-transpeptidase [Synergistaceae bacterium]|nr:L,D-transpeptidase [Synergistaceae bacterium]
MFRLAAVACILSVIVIGISAFMLSLPVEPKLPGTEEQAARTEPVSADRFEGIDPLETPEILEAQDERTDVVRSPDESASQQAQVSPKDEGTGKRTPKSRRAEPGTVVMIDKKIYKLSVVRDGRTVREYNVAVGKNEGDKERTGDMRTPEGEFKVQQFHDASSWKHDFKDGKGNINGAYGPLFIRLKTPPWSGIGIHGTHDPKSIGNNVTEGCVRMRNEELLEFAEMVDIGTPVIINP